MSIVAEVSKLLNDHEKGFEYIRWSKEEIQEYVNDALIQVAMLKPDAFSQLVEMPLKAGAMQELPENVTQLVDIVGTKNQFGCVSGKPSRLDTSASSVARTYFGNANCHQHVARGDYLVKGYEFDPNNPNVFYVSPPVPAGQSVSLLIQGVVIPSGENAKVPSKYHNAVIEWALYRAFGKDLESAADNQLSQQHLQHFYSILQLSQQAEDRLYNKSLKRSK